MAGLSVFITKTCLCNVDPLKPHFYIVKLGFTEYTLFFLFLLKNIDCGYSLEPNEYPQSMCWAEIWKISEFLSEFFFFFFFFFGGGGGGGVKFSVFLNRLVFVMCTLLGKGRTALISAFAIKRDSGLGNPATVSSVGEVTIPTVQFSVDFVCVEVLRPSQPNGVMSSAVSLPNHTFTGQV